jgi:dTDP-4-dehydrorhamnose reductase
MVSKQARRVLITGGGGQLASDLEALLLANGDVEVRAPTKTELDITDDLTAERLFEEIRPELVFNCAAYHQVDRCEQEERAAFEVNVHAVKRLAESSSKQGAAFVHLSTNYVFPGDRPEPYTERDLPAPRCVYAISKLAGEHAALAYADAALVVRTAGLYGLRGSGQKGGSFVTRMLEAGRQGQPIRMVADQRLSPTFSGDLAAALLDAVEKGCRGLLHLTNSGACSWYEFTLAIFELAGIDAEVEPIDTVPRPGGADRPLNGVLASDAADAAGLAPLRDWREALADYMERAGLLATSGERP